MTTTTPRFAALALSLMMTGVIFSGVSSLYTPAPAGAAGAIYAQAEAAPEAPRL